MAEIVTWAVGGISYGLFEESKGHRITGVLSLSGSRVLNEWLAQDGPNSGRGEKFFLDEALATAPPIARRVLAVYGL